MQGDTAALRRQAQSLLLDVQTARAQQAKTETELLDCERTLRSRIGQLSKQLQETQSRVSVMQELDRWVPREEFSKLLAQHESLAARHRELLMDHERHAPALVQAQDWLSETLRLKQLLDDAELKVKQQSTRLQKFDAVCSAPDKSPPDALKLQARIVALESNEEHNSAQVARLTDRHDMLQKQYQAVEKAHAELEKRYKAQQTVLLAERDVAVELRRKADVAASPEQLLAAQRRVAALEQQLAETQARLEQQRAMALVATQQLHRVHDAQERDQSTIDGLRLALLQFEQQSDDHALVGKVEHELIAVKLEKQHLARELAVAKEQQDQAEAGVMRMEMQLQEQQSRFFSAQNEARAMLARYRLDAGEAVMQKISVLSLEQADELRSVNAELLRRIDTDREWKQQMVQDLGQVQLERDRLLLDLAQNAELREALTAGTEHGLKRKVVKWEQAVRAAKRNELQMQNDLKMVQAEADFAREAAASQERMVQRLQAKLVDMERDQVWDDPHSDGDETPQRDEGVGPGRKAPFTLARPAFKSGSRRRQEMQAYDVFPTGKETAAFKSAALQSKGNQTAMGTGVADVMADTASLLHKQLADLRTELHVAQEQLAAKDRSLKDVQATLQSQLAQSQRHASHSSAAVDLVHSVQETEKQRIMQMAQEQIRSLQTLIEQKNKSIISLETLISEQQHTFTLEKSKDQREIAMLNEMILKHGDDHLGKMKQAFEQLESMPLASAGLVSADEMDRQKKKDRHVAVLTGEAEKYQRLAQAAQAAQSKAEAELQKAKTQLADHEMRVGHTSLTSVVKTLKAQLADKEDKMTAMQGAIKQLKEELLQLSDEAQTRSRRGGDFNASFGATSASSSVDLAQLGQMEAKQAALNKKLKASQTALVAAGENVKALESTLARTQSLLADEKTLTTRLREGLKKYEGQTADLQQRVVSEKARADREATRVSEEARKAEHSLNAVIQLQVDVEELSLRIRNHVCSAVAPATFAVATVSTQHSNPASRPASRSGTPRRTSTSEPTSLPGLPQPPPWTPPYTLPGSLSSRGQPTDISLHAPAVIPPLTLPSHSFAIAAGAPASAFMHTPGSSHVGVHPLLQPTQPALVSAQGSAAPPLPARGDHPIPYPQPPLSVDHTVFSPVTVSSEPPSASKPPSVSTQFIAPAPVVPSLPVRPAVLAHVQPPSSAAHVQRSEPPPEADHQMTLPVADSSTSDPVVPAREVRPADLARPQPAPTHSTLSASVDPRAPASVSPRHAVPPLPVLSSENDIPSAPVSVVARPVSARPPALASTAGAVRPSSNLPHFPSATAATLAATSSVAALPPTQSDVEQKLRKQVATLKSKVEELTAAVASAQTLRDDAIARVTSVERARDLIDKDRYDFSVRVKKLTETVQRLENEKSQLQGVAQQHAALLRHSSDAKLPPAAALPYFQQIHQLQEQLATAEAKTLAADKLVQVEQASTVHRLQTENATLKAEVDKLTAAMKPEDSETDSDADALTFRAHMALQDKLLKVESELLELRFAHAACVPNQTKAAAKLAEWQQFAKAQTDALVAAGAASPAGAPVRALLCPFCVVRFFAPSTFFLLLLNLSLFMCV